MNINEYISILVEDTSNELLKIYFNNHENRKTKLIFPENKNGDKRISEQEMRFTLLNIHEKNSSNLYYSVETPTTEDYGFSSDGKRRASSDLSFYNADVKVLNIELKAHNAEEDAINKDIEKLVSEDCNGAWIQLLKSENKGSVKRLFEKFEEAFKSITIL